jgi:hypothetical protein
MGFGHLNSMRECSVDNQPGRATALAGADPAFLLAFTPAGRTRQFEIGFVHGMDE